MAKIHILAQEEALKIAAGEVIERPAHVVKELLENALDAGATAITLYIEKAGKELIHIVDNGSGMAPDDAHACFLPHATSKIKSIHDLEHIASFGFRGEALASIAAISKVTLTTKTHELPDDALGIFIEYSESKVLTEKPIACPAGTSMEVANLFFNTPVRKKFLKTDETEWNAIQSIFQAYSISNPTIHFKLFHDKKLVLNAPGVKHAKDRAAQLWDHNFAQNLITVSSDPQYNGQQEKPAFTITGYISNHNFWRYGRQYMHFFVNKRWVKNNELGKAVMKGFLNVLPQDRFPAALIFIDIDQQYLDVNIHPKKEEIKFTRPGVIQTTLALLIKKTLEEQLTQRLTAHPSTPIFSPLASNINAFSAPGKEDFAQVSNKFESDPPNNQPPFVLSVSKHTNEFLSSPQIFPKPAGTTFSSVLYAPIDITTPTHTQHAQQQLVSQTEQQPKIIGQLFNTYIILQSDQETIFIDQHAAHERILYEKFQKNFTLHEGTILLFPEVITLSQTQAASICNNHEFFSAQGISFDALGARDIAIRSTPPQLKGQELREFILEAAQFIEDNVTLEPTLFGKKFSEHLHGQMACKSAVKAGDVLTLEQMTQLITDLQTTANRFICVHGRPTTWSISKTHIEKQFQRI